MNGRVEIITSPERRRRWSDEEKLQLVAEACQPGNSVSQVARAWDWRQMRRAMIA
jgi:transposase